MYCTDCGKEVSENDKFCKNCGKSIRQERLSENSIGKTENKELSMKYFNFYSKIYLGLIAILNVIGMTTYGNVEKWEPIIIMTFILELILYIIFPLILSSDMKKKTKFSYKVLISFLALDYLYKVSILSIKIHINNPQTQLTIYMLLATAIYGMWFIPNIIYFVKRKKYFIN